MIKLHMSTTNNKPEIAGVSMPSPMSMHIPRIAINNNALLAVMLRSKNFPSLLGLLANAD
jgi:hypothetical protein